MFNRNNKGVIEILAILIIVLVLLALLIVLYMGVFTNTQTRTSCSEIETPTFTQTSSCSQEGDTMFSLAFSEELDGFRLALINNQGSQLIDVRPGSSVNNMRMIEGNFGEPLTFPKTGIATYVITGIYNALEVQPIVNGQTCAATSAISISPCHDFNPPVTQQGTIQLSDEGRQRRSGGSSGGGSSGGSGGDDGSPEPITLTLTSPQEGQTFDTTTIPLAFTIDGNPSSCWYILDGGDSVTIPNCQDTQITTTEGQHEITVFTRNSDGVQDSDGANFVVDLDALIITNITTDPELPITTNESLPISVDFDSNKFPVNVTFNLFDENNNAMDTQGPHIVNNESELPIDYIVPDGLADGTYRLDMTVEDNQNNTVTVTLGNIIIDTTQSLVCNGAGEDQLIMSIAADTNAHGELWDAGNYGGEVCYNEIFGETFNGPNPHECTGNNKVLGLSQETNAHAETPDRGVYGYDVCYGNLVCQARTTACESGEHEIVALSSETNAHLELPDRGNYGYHICCSL